ncbi:universal stress protein [Kitasatospora aburaviensis]|uniref:Universal stress protein n=1 Tax=Kitasatospora aburaviensis TaxID=67265 RepID=A0ABW1F7F0_9ACTN
MADDATRRLDAARTRSATDTRLPSTAHEPENTVNRPIVVGFDGSPESLAATDWAALEASRRRLPLELLQAWPWPKTDVLGTADAITWSRHRLGAKEATLHAELAGLEVTSAHVPHDPAEALEAAGRGATMLVLGSRGLSTLQGFLVGSVSQEVLGRATCPVVLVRVREDGPEADAQTQDVLIGLDVRQPADDVLAFAFEAAALRSARLRAVHAWAPPVGSEYMAFAAIGGAEKELSAAASTQLADTLTPWRTRYPQVDARSDLVRGNAADVVVDASATAGLVVLGRRSRRLPLGPHLGPVVHAAIHHVRCPVVIVPHH